MADFLSWLGALPQSWATLIGAALVLAGVRWTMLENRRKARQDHLESRAARKHELLKQYYGEFVSIALGRATDRIYLALAHEKLARLRLVPPVERTQVHLEAIKLFQERVGAMVQADEASLRPLIAAAGRLLIYDEANSQRRRRMARIYTTLSLVEPTKSTQDSIAIRNRLHTFNYYVRRSLEAEYQESLVLAKRCEVPPHPKDEIHEKVVDELDAAPKETTRIWARTN